MTDSAPALSGALAVAVAVPSGTSRQLAATGAVSVAQASSGFRRLQLPTTVSGSSSAAVAGKLADSLSSRLTGARVLTGGAGSSGTAAPAGALTAGGNLGAALSTGDVTAAMVGTTTLVCGGTVVGFGHPIEYEGVSTYSLHPASAIYVQPDPTLAPFKVGNLGGVAGTVDRDRLTGIRGRLGAGEVKQGAGHVPADESAETALVAHAGKGAARPARPAPYQGVGGNRVVDLQVTPPTGSAGDFAFLSVSGGDTGWFSYDDGPIAPVPGMPGGSDGEDSLDDVLAGLATSQSSVVSAQLQTGSGASSSDALDTGRAVEGFEVDLPVRVRR